MINKKSQGMPLNVIIIAVLGLIVLVVLAAMFVNKSKDFSSGLGSCSAKQGTCQGAVCDSSQTEIPNSCPEKNHPGKYCCAKILG